MEIKLKPDRKSLNQAVGETMMFSFIHHNRHPEQQSLVPGLLLNPSSFWIILYDCVADVLLVSDRVDFLQDSPGIVSVNAVAIL